MPPSLFGLRSIGKTIQMAPVGESLPYQAATGSSTAVSMGIRGIKGVPKESGTHGLMVGSNGG